MLFESIWYSMSHFICSRRLAYIPLPTEGLSVYLEHCHRPTTTHMEHIYLSRSYNGSFGQQSEHSCLDLLNSNIPMYVRSLAEAWEQSGKTPGRETPRLSPNTRHETGRPGHRVFLVVLISSIIFDSYTWAYSFLYQDTQKIRSS